MKAVGFLFALSHVEGAGRCWISRDADAATALVLRWQCISKINVVTTSPATVEMWAEGLELALSNSTVITA